ncbi:MAG: transcriptional regulator domain-containing protein [Rhodomicrobiaceae bacterium]
MSVRNWPLSLDSYDYLVGQPPSAWAWEFLRRNKRYRAQAEKAFQTGINPSHTQHGLRITRLSNPQPEALTWALCSFRRSRPYSR